MSNKRKQENIAFSVSITPDKRQKNEEEIVAILAPFNPFPKVCFEYAKLNETVMQNVSLQNPTKSTIQVELTKLPDSSKGFHFSCTELELPSQSQTVLTIFWTPTEYGSWRDNIKITNKKTKKTISEIILLYSTVEPLRDFRRTLRTRTQSNLKPVIHKKTKDKTLKDANFTKFGKEPSENKENTKITFVKSSNITEIEQYTLVSEVRKVTRRTVATATVTSTKVSSKQLTPRRDTYEVVAPSSSRRSTYTLRNKHLSNIVDLEDEKIKFENIVSPGILNESLEKAASKLIESTPESCEAGCPSAALLEQTNTTMSTCIYVDDGNQMCYDSPRRKTYEVLPSAMSICKTRSVGDTKGGRLPQVDKQVERLSLESQAGSEKFFDSLEEVSPKSDTVDLNFDSIVLSPPSENARNPLNSTFLSTDINPVCGSMNFDISKTVSENISPRTVHSNDTYPGNRKSTDTIPTKIPRGRRSKNNSQISPSVATFLERNHDFEITNKETDSMNTTFVNTDQNVHQRIYLPTVTIVDIKPLCNEMNVDLSKTIKLNQNYSPLICKTRQSEKKTNQICFDSQSKNLQNPDIYKNMIDELEQYDFDVVPKAEKTNYSSHSPPKKVSECSQNSIVENVTMMTQVKTEPVQENEPCTSKNVDFLCPIVKLEIVEFPLTQTPPKQTMAVDTGSQNCREIHDSALAVYGNQCSTSSNIPDENRNKSKIWDISPPRKEIKQENTPKNISKPFLKKSSSSNSLKRPSSLTRSGIHISPYKLRKTTQDVKIKRLSTPVGFKKPTTPKDVKRLFTPAAFKKPIIAMSEMQRRSTSGPRQREKGPLRPLSCQSTKKRKSSIGWYSIQNE